jgi:hypothetical protein
MANKIIPRAAADELLDSLCVTLAAVRDLPKQAIDAVDDVACAEVAHGWSSSYPAYRIDAIDAMCKLDRIVAAVNLAHDVIRISTTLGLRSIVQEKLDTFRDELEAAHSVEVAHA